MIEKDDIQDLFSRSLENHTTPVRPEVWTGLQAKMAAAGLTTAAGATAAKGMSLVTKWIIGTAAVVTTTVGTTLIVMQQDQPAKETRQVAIKEQNPVSGDIIAEEKPAVQNPTAGNSASAEDVQENHVFTGGGSATKGDPTPHSIPFVFNEPQRNTQTNEVASSGQDKAGIVENKEAVTTTGTDNKTVAETPKGQDIQASEPAGKKVDIEPIKFVDVFTPNGDGINDKYFLLSRQDVSPDGFSITILDAKFKVVVTSSDPNFEWDGMMANGDPAPEGSYTSVVVGKYLDNTTKLRERGKFTLIRK